MQKYKYGKIFPNSIILLIIIIGSVSVGLRSCNREFVSDDLLYKYILDENPLGNNQYKVQVRDLHDAINSQSSQYFYSNGRFIVHVMVQMFAGPWGMRAYGLFNAILFAVIIILFIIYTVPKQNRFNPLLWILLVIAYLYLFQGYSSSWYSIAGGMNYLYPMMPSLCYLLVFRILKSRTLFVRHCFIIVCLAILGIVTGWSQECFSVPLCGGLFLYSIINFKKITLYQWILNIFLWIGGCILVFAPGNFVRLSTSPDLIVTGVRGLSYLLETVFIWLLLIIILVGYLLLKNFSIKSFLNRYSLNWIVLGVAVLFGFIANTLPQSFNGVSFFSLIIIFNLLGKINFRNKNKYIVMGCSILLFITVSIHQVRIIQTVYQLKKIHHQFIIDYIASSDGVVKVPEVNIPNDVQPFVKSWFQSNVYGWIKHTINCVYGNNKKPIVWLDKNDYEGFNQKNISKLKTIYSCNDTVAYYIGEKHIWFEKRTISVGDTIEILYDSAPPAGDIFSAFVSLKHKLTGESSSRQRTEIVDTKKFLKGKYHDAVRVEYPTGVQDIIIRPHGN